MPKPNKIRNVPNVPNVRHFLGYRGVGAFCEVLNLPRSASRTRNSAKRYIPKMTEHYEHCMKSMTYSRTFEALKRTIQQYQWVMRSAKKNITCFQWVTTFFFGGIDRKKKVGMLKHSLATQLQSERRAYRPGRDFAPPRNTTFCINEYIERALRLPAPWGTGFALLCAPHNRLPAVWCNWYLGRRRFGWALLAMRQAPCCGL